MDFRIRENRQGAQGRRALVRERAEYFRLMDQGFTNTEACRIVGINRRTGKRWRHGRQATGATRGAPPVRRPLSPDRPSRYLRESDRIHIADRLREKASIRQIAAELGRSPSTISREIRRNGMPLRGDTSRWAYRPHAAQSRADARRLRPKPGKIGQNPELRDFIRTASRGAGVRNRSACFGGPRRVWFRTAQLWLTLATSRVIRRLGSLPCQSSRSPVTLNPWRW